MRHKSFAGRPDLFLLFAVIGLVLFGIVMIGSANGWDYNAAEFSLDTLMVKQFVGLMISLVLIFILLRIPYDLLKVCSIPLYLLSLVLLLLVLKYGIGATEGDEVRRWLSVQGLFSIQPSELTKVLIILLLASYFEHFQKRVSSLAVLAGAALISLIPLYLVYKEPDLSTTLVLAAVVFACFFAAGVNRWYILAAIALVGAGIWLIYRDAISDSPRILNEYQVNRILAWLHPEDYSLTLAYQSIRSRMAIGSGGIFGKGLFQNSGLVPVATTDFIFGIIGEELGLFGGTLIILWIFVISGRILMIGFRAEDLFGKVLCAGIAVMIAFQSLVHIGVTVAVLPNTGIPLPFISSGLSSLVSNMVAVGLVLRVDTHHSQQPVKRRY